ncbi:MAG: hypothetical protein IPJ33_11955 [Gammaproteobacteria bacterium]|nr:hypothetical protein [Gammaproteobacteria bacterium]MBK7729175.1 hypothetical protein [Gammaproteobacteria bacterium]
MSACIIHYGMPKTGSSSIQTYLLRSLADPRFFNLDLGRRGSGNIIAAAFLAHPEQHHRNIKLGLTPAEVKKEIQATRAALARELERADGRTALLSAELLANFSALEFAALCDFIRPRAAGISAVGYVRSPLAFMESVFQQRVKSGLGSFRLEQNYPRYRERFEKFETVLGRERVAYWSFAPASFPGNCVVQDFCARLGIRCDGAAVQRINDSLSLPAIRLLYAYRKYGPGFGAGERALRENALLKTRLRELGGPPLRFHAALVRPVLDARRADIAWMEERLQHPFAESPVADHSAVQGEADLLRYCPESIAWLACQLGRSPLDAATIEPPELAKLVHELRVRLAAAAPPAPVRQARGALARLLRLLRQAR